MMRVLTRGGAETNSCDAVDAIWFDLEAPTDEEEKQVEILLGVDVPTPAERAAIEESARFYEDAGALHVTATLLGRRDEGPFVAGPVTFILAQNKLVTVRQIKPRAFEIGQGRSSARIGSAQNGADVFIALIEGAAERLADLLAEATRDANAQSAAVFAENPPPNLRECLRALGRIGTLTSLAHESLSSVSRLLAFTRTACKRHGVDDEKIAALERDVAELERLAEGLQPRISYLQDAALGLINAAQTDVLKALSLATIAFVPPTLIASVFGMNFTALAWIHKPWGPWIALLLMIAAPSALFVIAKWRRWF